MSVLPILAALGSLQGVNLRADALSDPLSLQNDRPEFSWELRGATDAKNLSQSAYRLIVASSPNLLAKDEGDLWDTGKVLSSSTFGIRYAGSQLRSRGRAWWKVQIWDQAGREADWSSAASFGIGLLNPTDWKAKWIHGDAPKPLEDLLQDAKWITPPGTTPGEVPNGNYTCRLEFESDTTTGKIALTADNTFVARLNGVEIGRTTDPEGWSRLQSLDLKGLKVGKNALEVEVNNVGKGHSGLLARLSLGNKAIISDKAWTIGGKPAAELGPNGVGPWNKVRATGKQWVVSPAYEFQNGMKLKGKVKRATAYVTALGIVDFAINGKRVTDDLFTPGWTSYKQRTHYRTFDVTKNLKDGDNTLSATLGQGWFSGYVAWGAQREYYGKVPMFKAQVEVEYADGSTETFATDESWKVGSGPILDEHFLYGERFDARKELGDFKPAKVGSFSTSLEAFPGDPVRSYAEIKPESITEVSKGVYQINFGQNLTGFVRLKVNEAAGTKVAIRHAERLDKDGRIYTTNLRFGEAQDEYTCKGGGETWNPRLTFHGFQYIEVTGLSRKPSKDTFTALAISSATPETGTIQTSDPMLNKLVSNAWWTQKMNFVDVPTDCPQRDERLGWTGDAQAYILTASYYSDVQAFFRKWLVTLDDDQEANGNYPKVSPVIWGLDDGGPAWGDAGVICPTTVYEVYGDKTVLERHYPNMVRFVEFCRGRQNADLLPPEKFHCFGDWLSIKADTPNDVIAQAYFAYSTGLVAKAAEELGKKEDAAKYSALRDRAAEAFRKAYVTADGQVKGNTQCSYVLALAFDLVEGDLAKKVADRLVKDIESRKWHLSTGFVGTRDLMHVLSKIGRNDVAYRLLHNTTFPSWGFSIVNGATSIWERWDGWTPDKGFQDPGMNSFAHYAYGAVVGWMFKTVGGISPMEPGYGMVKIAPVPDPNLTFAKTSYKSVRGMIRTHLKRVGKGYELEVVVPPNVNAEVHVPLADGGTRKEIIGSGTWTFKG